MPLAAGRTLSFYEVLGPLGVGGDRDDWGNRTFDAMPDGDLLISVEEPSDVTLRVVLDWDP